MTDVAHISARRATKRSLVALSLIALVVIGVLISKESGVRGRTEPIDESEWRPVAGAHWAAVAKLIGGASDQYFVLIDLHYLAGSVALEDAGHALCGPRLCDIGFFAHAEDVPPETSSADFFQKGGWATTGEIVHYYQHSSERQIKWDCDFVRQLFLDDCLSPPGPTLSQRAIMHSRPPLLGFARARFGMSLANLKVALNEHRRTWVLRPAMPAGIDVIETSDTFGGVVFSSFYNVINSQFRSVALVMSENLAGPECFQNEERIADWVDHKYGKRDQFAYYNKILASNELLWRFPSGAQISLTNLAPKGGGCVLRLTFEDKPSE